MDGCGAVDEGGLKRGFSSFSTWSYGRGSKGAGRGGGAGGCWLGKDLAATQLDGEDAPWLDGEDAPWLDGEDATQQGEEAV